VKKFKVLIILLIGVIFFFPALYLWSSYPWKISPYTLNQQEIKKMEIETEYSENEAPSVIKVLTWNLGFLLGEGSAGPGYSRMDLDFYQKKLKLAVDEIKSWDVDVIFFQEIDFSSQRSHFLNQAELIAQEAGYPYVAQIVSWEANYVPFPFWPIKNHFGKMNSGGAVLSRYPLRSLENHYLPKPPSRPWWYNLFYLYRYFQVLELDLSGTPLKIINLHLEAFDKENRKTQVNSLLKIIEELDPFLVAGDFNMLPKDATRKSKFSDADNYEDDVSYALMEKSGLLEVIPNEIYAQEEKAYFTYPAKKPDRRLDYIFYSPHLKLMRAEILPSQVSDHLPVRASFQIGPPKVNPYSL
jgi:endonuclease/exonuclease/phosphatase family metal-dependent hydrolase